MKILAPLTIVLLLTISLGACAQRRVPQQETPGPPQIVGFYECKGLNQDGSSYEGVVEIVKNHETYRVYWTFEDKSVVGVGILRGNVFAVSYSTDAPTVVVFRIDGDHLIGEWVMGGAEGHVLPEVLTKTDKRPPPPEPRKPSATPPHQQAPPTGVV